MYLFVYDGPFNILYGHHKYFNLEQVQIIAPSAKMNHFEDLKNLNRVNKYVQIGLKEDQFVTFHIADDDEAVAFMISQDEVISKEGKDVKTKLLMVLKDPDWSSLDLDGHRERVSESNRLLSQSKLASGSKNYKKAISDFKIQLSHIDFAMKSDLTAHFEAFEEQLRQKLTEYDQERSKLLQPLQAERNKIKQQFESFIVRKA